MKRLSENAWTSLSMMYRKQPKLSQPNTWLIFIQNQNKSYINGFTNYFVNGLPNTQIYIKTSQFCMYMKTVQPTSPWSFGRLFLSDFRSLIWVDSQGKGEMVQKVWFLSPPICDLLKKLKSVTHILIPIRLLPCLPVYKRRSPSSLPMKSKSNRRVRPHFHCWWSGVTWLKNISFILSLCQRPAGHRSDASKPLGVLLPTGGSFSQGPCQRGTWQDPLNILSPATLACLAPAGT